MTALRFRGAISALSGGDRQALFQRGTSIDSCVTRDVAAILAEVRARGDAALRDLSARYDAAVPGDIEVPRSERQRALDSLDAGLRRAMERSLTNIERVHRAGLPQPVVVVPEPGVSIVRRPDPLDRVGIYAPGGRAAYPSSVLMSAVPARVAGVREVTLCSPPGANGLPSDVVLAAAELAGVDRVFATGGAGAIAAMAFGTASVPRADRIVGPGNAWVAEAKQQVVGFVAIDAPAGPSELLVIADAAAPAGVAAIEMLAQAEHDPLACVVAVAVGNQAARAIEAALDAAIEVQPRASIIRAALASRGGVLEAADLDEALAFANAYAPEHLLLIGGGPPTLVDRVRGAGTICVGETTSVAFGDYITGANHVLPTGGLGRAYSGLSVLDFVRWTTCQRVDLPAARSLALDVTRFAEAEGLGGHAAAARQWRVA
jgi:histidinol dehydrogenase